MYCNFYLITLSSADSCRKENRLTIGDRKFHPKGFNYAVGYFVHLSWFMIGVTLTTFLFDTIVCTVFTVCKSRFMVKDRLHRVKIHCPLNINICTIYIIYLMDCLSLPELYDKINLFSHSMLWTYLMIHTIHELKYSE